jgi:hypothetical protein
MVQIGDFGETVEIPAANRQDDAYGARFSDRGADEFRTPVSSHYILIMKISQAEAERPHRKIA